MGQSILASQQQMDAQNHRPSDGGGCLRVMSKSLLGCGQKIGSKTRLESLTVVIALHVSCLPCCRSQLFSELDSSIAGAIKFVLELLKEEKQLFGLEGMNAGMSEAHRLMAVCFDWGRLVNTGPRVEDAKAFSDLCKLLMPYLRHTLWPLPEQFPEVIARWPGNQ